MLTRERMCFVTIDVRVCWVEVTPKIIWRKWNYKLVGMIDDIPQMFKQYEVSVSIISRLSERVF